VADFAVVKPIRRDEINLRSYVLQPKIIAPAGIPVYAYQLRRWAKPSMEHLRLFRENLA
jgi:hypothetical protein